MLKCPWCSNDDEKLIELWIRGPRKKYICTVCAKLFEEPDADNQPKDTDGKQATGKKISSHNTDSGS